MEKRWTTVELKFLEKLGFDSFEIDNAKEFFEKGKNVDLSRFKIHLLTFLQFIRFSIGGTAAAISHLGMLVLLVEIFNLFPVLASAIGFVCAVLSSYLINSNITFNLCGSHRRYFVKFFIVCLLGLGLNTGIMYLAVNIIGIWYLWAQLCTMVVVPVNNFVWNKLWTFKY